MKAYATHYVPRPTRIDPNPTPRVAYVWARNDVHADALIIQRGLGERRVEAEPFSDFPVNSAATLVRAAIIRRQACELDHEADLETMHALVWLAHLATSSSACTPFEILSDVGWMHEAVHQMASASRGSDSRCYDALVEWIAAVERVVPGYRP